MVLPLKQKKPVSSRIIPLSCERDVLIWVAARFVHAMLKVSQERQEKKNRLTGLALKLYNVHIWWGREIIKQCPLWARERVWHFYDWFLVADSASATPPLWSAASDGRFSLARLQDVVAAARLSLQVLRKHTGANLVAIHFAVRNSTSIQNKKKAGNKHAFTFTHFAILHFAFLDLGTTGIVAFCNLSPGLNHSFTLCANIYELIADDWLCSWENEFPWGWIKYLSLHSNMNVRLRDKRLSHGE